MTRYALLPYAIVAAGTVVTAEAFSTIKPLGFTYNGGSNIFAKNKSRNKKNRIIVVPEEPMVDDMEFGTTVVDMNRAKQCAENFGMCSVSEMELLKSDLNHVRVKNLVLNGLMSPAPPTTLVEAVEYRVLEEELELQLALLKKHTPTPSLFPTVIEDSEMRTALPHLRDDPSVSSNSMAGSASTKASTLALKGSIMDESNLEPIMICMAIIALAFMPQLLT